MAAEPVLSVAVGALVLSVRVASRREAEVASRREGRSRGESEFRMNFDRKSV
ncbi:hypothetical protein [Nostoc sp. DedQUE03]|uniref:hypothetical protein n=1 Tax=Nostoc sp. DedQUE03 TaxID=3075389 RepID=UPI002AD37E94|nr:hypothetical protein [Nostoc sp. DedQUE03]MDZ7976073.1 hypothetical protein [Nostoc sp. DedQUE03]MDZ8044049.1 hypothetical protein [Nostoc sp. DedQUE02]